MEIKTEYQLRAAADKERIKAIPHNPCASVCATSTGVEAQIFVKFRQSDGKYASR